MNTSQLCRLLSAAYHVTKHSVIINVTASSLCCYALTFETIINNRQIKTNIYPTYKVGNYSLSVKVQRTGAANCSSMNDEKKLGSLLYKCLCNLSSGQRTRNRNHILLNVKLALKCELPDCLILDPVSYWILTISC